MAEGAAGRTWLEALVGVVDALAREWALSVGAAFSSGSEGLVLEARLKDGREAVLKVLTPGADWAGEAKALALAEGRGYATLYASDEQRRAILIERLGPALAQSGLSQDAQVDALTVALKQAWRPAEGAGSFKTGAEKAHWLASFIEQKWSALKRPCAARTIEVALDYAGTCARAFDPARALVAHGDAHAWNALREHARQGYKFVDPEPLFVEPAYDLGVVLRTDGQDFGPGQALDVGLARCARVASLTGVDRTAIWRWAVVEQTSTGLLLTELGLEGADYLAVADAWAQAPW